MRLLGEKGAKVRIGRISNWLSQWFVITACCFKHPKYSHGCFCLQQARAHKFKWNWYLPQFFPSFCGYFGFDFFLADLAGGFLHWAGCGRDRESFDFQRQSLEFGMGKT